jgi:imidazolonepropionase-like amidohydrolase
LSGVIVLVKQILAIRCGKLIDAKDVKPLDDVIVLIEDGKFIKIGEGIPIPGDAEIIDASEKTVLPGLCDGHVHLNSDPYTSGSPLVQEATHALRAAKNARTTLEAGFTSILGHMGFARYSDLCLRDAINSGWVPGPRLWTSGGALSSSIRERNWFRYGIYLEGLETADGADEMRKFIRQKVIAGSDFIKTHATYAVGSGFRGECDMRNLTSEELEAIVDEAHAFHLRVKAHVEGRQSMKESLKAGVDIILHGFFIDDEDAETMVQNDIFYIPTLAWHLETVKTGAPGCMPWYLEKGKAYLESHIESFKRAYRAGVRIAMGTDCSAGASPGDFLLHGENAKELSAYVEYGMTPMEAIVSSTKTCAEAFGLEKLVGTVEVGKLADLTIIEGDPLKDITVLQDKSRIWKVIKEGITVVEDGVARAAPSTKLEPNLPGFLGK